MPSAFSAAITALPGVVRNETLAAGLPASVRSAGVLKVALDEGLDAATVRRIAAEAGVSLGTVHYCFGSKRALLEAVVESVSQPQLSGAFARVIADAQNRADSVQAATQGFVGRTQRTFTETQETVKWTFASKGGSQGVRPAGSTSAQDVLSERWQPLAVAAAAGTAFLVFLRKLLK